jgi:rubrerythrin
MTTNSIDERLGAAPPRRQFLRTAGLAVGGFGLLAAVGTPALAAVMHRPAGQANSDVRVMQGALALEHEGIAAYTIAGGSGLLTPDVLKIALVFLGHHKGHRDALADLIRKAGGKPVEPKTDAQYTAELNFGALKSQGDVVTLATKLEMGATNAYVGQIAALQDHQLAHLFAQISTDEAVHWAILNNALGAAVPTPPLIFG